MSNNSSTPNPAIGYLISLFSASVGVASLYNSNRSLGLIFIGIALISAMIAGFQAIARRNPTVATLIFISIAFGAFFLGNYSAAISGSQRSDTSKSFPTETSAPATFNPAKDQLSQAAANKLVQSWLDARSSIFGPPFDQEKLKQLTTDALYKDANNNMARLKSKRNSIGFSPYTTKVIAFSPSNKTPFLVVEVQGDYYYDGSPHFDNDTYTYIFTKKEAGWKITNYIACDILTQRCEQPK